MSDFIQFRRDLQDGKEHEIPKSTYDYFLGVLPPVTWDVPYQGQRWNFGFAEGFEKVTLFRKVGALNQYLAVQTPYFNPREAGTIESQKQRLRFEWAKIGKRQDSIRQHVKDFGILSIEEAKTDAELLEALAKPQPIGKAFHLGDICFICTSESGDWLILKDTIEVGKNQPVTLLVQEKDQGQRLIDDLRAANHGQLRQVLGR